MNRDEFRILLRDLLFDIHDVAALEKHRANDLFPRLAPNLSRAESLRRLVREGIEALRPRGGSENVETLEWRYYLILHGRYVEGESIAELQKRLALGERQERRLHGRALSALENTLWDRFFAAGKPLSVDAAPPGLPASEQGGEDVSYQTVLESLPLERIFQEVALLCRPRIEASGGTLTIELPDTLPQVQADRIILRQIALDLVSRMLQLWSAPIITISAVPNGGKVLVEVQVEAGTPISRGDASAEIILFPQGPVRYWIERLRAQLVVEAGEEMPVRFLLSLPQAEYTTILVVDDHEPAIRIIQRFLSHTNIQVAGITDPTQVLPFARATHPQAVLLDVMMPTTDGWELLQALKSDPETKDIPVIICSVWEQPDLAYSLGANGFLKKPISQAELLDELARSNLLDIADGSPLADLSAPE
jgi:CheY-like chemotaxis protein